jgi:hypothetical protein
MRGWSAATFRSAVNESNDEGLHVRPRQFAALLEGIRMTTMTKFREPTGQPLTTDLNGWVKVSGQPEMKTWVMHRSPDGGMISGIW